MVNVDIKYLDKSSDTYEELVDKFNHNFQAILEFIQNTTASVTPFRTVATEGQTLVTLSKRFVRNSNALVVFVNGVIQTRGDSYAEASDQTIRFAEGLAEGDEIYALIFGVREIGVETDS